MLAVQHAEQRIYLLLAWLAVLLLAGEPARAGRNRREDWRKAEAERRRLERDEERLVQIGMGKSNAEIAQALFVTPNYGQNPRFADHRQARRARPDLAGGPRLRIGAARPRDARQEVVLPVAGPARGVRQPTFRRPMRSSARSGTVEAWEIGTPRTRTTPRVKEQS